MPTMTITRTQTEERREEPDKDEEPDYEPSDDEEPPQETEEKPIPPEATRDYLRRVCELWKETLGIPEDTCDLLLNSLPK